MKAFLLACAFWAAPVWAGVTPIFNQNGTEATFLLSGMPGDPDAPGVWNAMVAPPENFQGKLAKRLFLDGADGKRAFDVDCVFSNVIQNYGSCTVIFRASAGLVEVSKAAGTARLWLTGAAAAKFAQQFSMREDSTVLFRSANGRLNFTVARDRGVVTDMVVDWK
jgi:hypothetical protein